MYSQLRKWAILVIGNSLIAVLMLVGSIFAIYLFSIVLLLNGVSLRIPLIYDYQNYQDYLYHYFVSVHQYLAGRPN